MNKSCACTGVRWCASCQDPLVREFHRMDDPVQIPELLSTRPTRPTHAGSNPQGQIHDFDLDLQSAPSHPAFQGVHVFRDFLSAGEAEQLMTEIQEAPFLPAQSGKLKQHYGPKINFNRQKVNVAAFRGLPKYVSRIESRLRELTSQDLAGDPTNNAALRTALETFEPTDAFVLRYFEQDASNLDFHRDDMFAYGEVILDLSLESDSVLTFLECNEAAPKTSYWTCVRVPLPARSLAVLYGSGRFTWDHAILAYDIAETRTSVTLRTLSEGLRESDPGKQILDIARGDRVPD